jgi:multiple sugar transport system permease protein
MGYASAIAITLFIVIMLLTLVQFRVGRSWVHYD